ncbi:hypothetical protein [Streptomyces sp. RerS4]|uniref:hypothetical protein n=1 Tax=Streptomyces sp. RerS4 TaxID=2942449 RepID=UPI00201BEB7A|nr:hypothetical protein [Streptomyces sp. RerS4]UQX04448.1 hypothetical protein M4D82_31020 [Streptomyces sp. RerS4]
MWQTSEFAGEHEGRPAAVLADGSEPNPLIFDMGSGSGFDTSTDWWDYDGTHGSPVAASVRAACSCGWRGERLHPIDWGRVGDDLPLPFSLDMDGPLGEWRGHMAGVEARAVPLPERVRELLELVTTELEALADTGPLAALRAVAALERTSARIAGTAAHYLGQDEVPVERVAIGLGISPRAARSRLFRYEG